MIAPESIAEILGLGTSIRTVGELELAVSEGLPKRALERLSARLYEDRRSASAYKFKVVPQATWLGQRGQQQRGVNESYSQATASIVVRFFSWTKAADRKLPRP